MASGRINTSFFSVSLIRFSALQIYKRIMAIVATVFCLVNARISRSCRGGSFCARFIHSMFCTISGTYLWQNKLISSFHWICCFFALVSLCVCWICALCSLDYTNNCFGVFVMSLVCKNYCGRQRLHWEKENRRGEAKRVTNKPKTKLNLLKMSFFSWNTRVPFQVTITNYRWFGPLQHWRIKALTFAFPPCTVQPKTRAD